MKHEFNGNRCIYCGISLAVSGYSEECPNRSVPSAARRIAHEADSEYAGGSPRLPVPAAYRPQVRLPKPGQEMCPRCREYAWFNIQKESKTSGYLGVDLPNGGHVVRPIQSNDEFRVCSNCGYRMPVASASGDCFVATAVYGDCAHPSVMALRRFRDNSLSRCCVGRVFIAWYYRVGPELGRLVAPHRVLRWCVKGVLELVVGMLRVLLG